MLKDVLYSCLVCVGLLLVTVGVDAQQVCKTYRPVTTPSYDFVVGDQGTVIHRPTALMWLRCSIGQTWNGTTCVGVASKYSWDEAALVAEASEFAGFTDWRLPNRKELESLLERQCEMPMINTEIFPNVPPGWYWTASTLGGTSEREDHLAWYVSFALGRVHTQHKDVLNRVRLVRWPP